MGRTWSLPDANEIDINNLKCTCPTPAPMPETQLLSFALGKTRKKFASPNARDTNMLVFLALGNAKVLSFVLGDAKVPNANDFVLQWNIGFRILIKWEKSCTTAKMYHETIYLFTICMLKVSVLNIIKGIALIR